MAAAWDSARVQIKKAQRKQKRQRNKHIRFQIGDNVLVYVPASRSL